MPAILSFIRCLGIVVLSRFVHGFHFTNPNHRRAITNAKTISRTTARQYNTQSMESDPPSRNIRGVQQTILKYFDICQNALSYKPREIQSLFHSSVEYVDTTFYNMPLTEPTRVCRHIQLTSSNVTNVVDEWAISHNSSGVKACVVHHKEDMSQSTPKHVPCSQAITIFHFVQDKSTMEWVITKVFVVLEPSEPKPGTIGLQVLKMASMVLDSFSNLERDQHDEIQRQEPSTSLSKDWIIYKYFDAWNQRRMHEAIQCFTPDVTYYDLQYSHPMIGTLQMEQHLHKVAESLPRGFQFVIDDVIVDEHDLKVGLQWHVENHGQTLPFTRGCSFYHLLSSSDYKIQRGLDIPEPAVIKPGFLQRIGSQLVSEPQRILPLIVWFAYMYVVFLSNGILPGANALSLEVRTWEEVRDLSLNFFLVAPLLHLPFSPTVHPMLEGIFNVLLAWAAMFIGFLSDERDNKPNRFPFGVMVVGMQFLTSAFLLPYLVTRTSESTAPVDNPDNTEIYTPSLFMRIAEWKPLGALFASIGTGAIFWSLFGRPEYGSIPERTQSLIQVLSIDRVGSSFIVDLIIFSLFQGWLIEDDLRRRVLIPEETSNTSYRLVGQYIPFYGLAVYFWKRPDLLGSK